MQNSSLLILWIHSLKVLCSVSDHQRKAGKILQIYRVVKRLSLLLVCIFLLFGLDCYIPKHYYLQTRILFSGLNPHEKLSIMLLVHDIIFLGMQKMLKCVMHTMIFFPFYILFLFLLQTLSSLALVFALHHYKPTPLYVMDEIDAALGTYH